MSLDAEFRAGLAAIIAQVGGVTVVSSGVTATGLRVGQTQETEFTENGETGVTTGTVRVSGADMSKPDRGSTILIGGETCVVTNVEGDTAIWVIRYRKARPVEGV